MGLFSRHAFQNDKRIEGYEMLSEEVVSYTGGLPLALEVLGSFLHDKDKDEWKCALARLKDIPDDEVTKRLKISYDGLTANEKVLFLDIACCFKDKDEAMKVLDACDLHPGIGIKVLVQKALIKVDSDGRFEMHDLIEEMAHYIVRGEHPKSPEKHSRMWNREDIAYLCDMGADAPPMETEVLLSDFLGLSYAVGLSDVVANMKKLRWIRFFSYPASPFPSNFQPKELGYLELLGSQQKELWHGYKHLPNLKIIDLRHSYFLTTTPDFEGLPCLERLILKFCMHLEEIHPSIGYHKRLVFVDMECCLSLKRFPPIIHMKNLEALYLRGCEKLQQFPDIRLNMDSLVTLNLGITKIEIIPPSVARFCTNLVSFDLRNCRKLKRIEGNFHLLKSLKDLDLSYCIGLQSFHHDGLVSLKLPQFPRFLRKLDLSWCELGDGDIPSDIFCELLNLQVLDLRGNKFSRLPSGLSQIPCLKLLDMSWCYNLLELPDLPSSIAILKATGCPSLKIVRDLSDYKWLWKVSLPERTNKRVLLSMLEGNAVANRFMSVLSPVIEPSSRIFTRLVTLQLPSNWYSDFSGLLLFLRSDNICGGFRYDIRIKQETSAYDYSEESDEDWEQCMYERVGYVPFNSLRHIPWLNPTYTKNISFHTKYGGHNVELVRSKNKIVDLNENSIDYSECWGEEYEHTKTFKIMYDSQSCDIHIVWTH
ncbi:putative P-loop containing nucleoside triphosphate hydrolase, leucine-rich repeat domain superfamily [Helianthus anomalus]